MEAVAGDIITPEFEADPDDVRVARHGLGFRGLFSGGISLHLARLSTSHGELFGMLSVRMSDRMLFKGRFNASSLSTRKTVATYLKDRSAYDGWQAVLEKFCWHVLTIEEEGPDRQVVGGQPRRGRIPCLVDPILPLNEPTILFGEGGSGKSTIAAALAVSVQLGVPIYPGWMPVQGNVLVLDWESAPEAWNDRIVGIANGLNVEPPKIEYRRCAHRLCDLGETIAAQVSQLDIRLVIVDSVGLAQGPAGDGGANDATLRLFGALRLFGVTSLLIDHVAKSSIESTRQTKRTPYDSVYKVNLARSVFDLRREANPEYPEASQVAMMHTKTNDQASLGTFGLRVIHGENAIVFERCTITAPDLEEQTVTIADRIKRALGRGPMTTQELAEELDVHPGAIRKTVSRGNLALRLPDQRWALQVAL